MSELSFSTCEECGGNIERVITGGTGLIFKGSGFYQTDYKDGKTTEQGETVNKAEGNKDKLTIDKKKTKNNSSESKSKSKKAGKLDD